MHEKELGAVLPAPMQCLRKKKKKRKMVDPCNNSGKKQEGALEENKNPPEGGFLEFLLKWEREWISIITMCRLRETEHNGSERSRYNKPRSKAEGREGH